MTNPNVLKRLDTLCALYKQRWGKDIDYTVLPKGITQEKLVDVLQRIVDTSESILVGYNKLFIATNQHHPSNGWFAQGYKPLLPAASKGAALPLTFRSHCHCRLC